MMNDFGAEYLDSVEAVTFGGRTVAKQQCHMIQGTTITECSWIVYQIDL